MSYRAQKLQSDTSETVLNVSKKYYDKVTKHSWVKKLSDLYDCDYKVIAVPGCSNESIMNNFYKHKNEYDRKTLVVIMWSSKFRHKLLARALYFTSEIGLEISEKLYTAVAIALAYIYKINNGENLEEPEIEIPKDLEFNEDGTQKK